MEGDDDEGDDRELRLELAMSMEPDNAPPAGTAAASSADEPEAVGPAMDLEIRWSGQRIAFSLPDNSTVGDLKCCLQEHTGVLTKRQKLIGVMQKGKAAPDSARLDQVKLAQKLMLIGNREEKIIKEPAPEDMPDVFNDMDIDYSGSTEPADSVRTGENLLALQQRIATVDVTLINPVRPEKKLLVFDLDYTLYDCGKESRAASGHEISLLKRPFADEMLATLWPHYEVGLLVFTQPFL